MGTALAPGALSYNTEGWVGLTLATVDRLEALVNASMVANTEKALEAIGLLRSIILSGERYSDRAEQVVQAALAALSSSEPCGPDNFSPRGEMPPSGDADGTTGSDIFHPPYRAVISDHGPVTIYDAVNTGWIARVKESLPYKRELAEAIVDALNNVSARTTASD